MPNHDLILTYVLRWSGLLLLVSISAIAGLADDDNDPNEQSSVYGAIDESAQLQSEPSNYSIVHEQIRSMGARTLLDVIKTLPGFDVVTDENGRHLVATRGIQNDTRTPLFTDGHRIQNTYNGHNFWEIPADLIESIEVCFDRQIKVQTRKHDGIQAHAWASTQGNSAGSIALGHWGDRVTAFTAAQLDISQQFAASAVAQMDILVSRKLDAHLITHGQFFSQSLAGAADMQFQLPYLKGNQFNVQVYLTRYQTLTMGASIDNTFRLGRRHTLVWNGNLDTISYAQFHRMTTRMTVTDSWQLSRAFQLLVGVEILAFSDLTFNPWNLVNPQISLSLRPHYQWTLDFNFRTWPRPPTFEQLSDASLKPEKITSFETHCSYRIDNRHQSYIVEGLGFLSHIANAIERLDESNNTNSYQNAGTYYVAGLEAQARAIFSDGSSAFFNVGWFRGIWHNTNWSLITDIPQLKANLGINLALPHIGNLNITTEFGSERRNNHRTDSERQHPFQIPPYARINMTFLSKPLLEYFVVEARAFNLIDGVTCYLGLLATI